MDKSGVLEQFENYLLSNLPKTDSFHPHYEKSLADMLVCGGKRFRPGLLLSVVNAYLPLQLENAFSVALAVECLHTYSLIHDDLPSMDNANLRRSQPTLHIAYDEVTAILAGDALNTYSFYLLSTAPFSPNVKCELIRLLSENGGAQGMVLGQAIDCHFENTLLDEERLTFLHTHKTGKLIAASLAMGAAIAGLEPRKIEELYEMGLAIGLFFQIRDDILDEVGTTQECGKPVRADSKKNSFITILGLDAARQRLEQMKEEIRLWLDKADKPLRLNIEQILGKYLQETL